MLSGRSSSSAQGQDQEAAPIDAEDPAETIEEAGRFGPSSTTVPDPVRQELASDPTARTFLLTVIHAETEEALPGVELHWKETPWGEYIPRAEYDQVVMEEGSVAVSEANGQIRLPWNENNIDMVAFHGYLYRAMRRSPDRAEEEHFLRLERDQEVVVTVRHAHGAPAVDVRVSHVQDFGNGNTREVTHRRTDADGIARFEHHQYYRRWISKRNRQFFVVGVASQEPPQHGFQLEDGLPADLKFTLPPVAEVHLYAFQADGSPYPGDGELSLQALAEGEEPDESFFGGREFDARALRGWDRREIFDGHARFLAALDERLLFALHHPHHDSDLVDQADGPTVEGMLRVFNSSRRGILGKTRCSGTGRDRSSAPLGPGPTRTASSSSGPRHLPV